MSLLDADGATEAFGGLRRGETYVTEPFCCTGGCLRVLIMRTLAPITFHILLSFLGCRNGGGWVTSVLLAFLRTPFETEVLKLSLRVECVC